MPAPATSSRHLYTGHHQGGGQGCPLIEGAQLGAPLSRGSRTTPVSVPSLFVSMRQQWYRTCSSSRRSPDPLVAGLLPQRSPPRLLTAAACGGLSSPPARRARRANLHHWHSTLRGATSPHSAFGTHCAVKHPFVCRARARHVSRPAPSPANLGTPRNGLPARRQPLQPRRSRPVNALGHAHPCQELQMSSRPPRMVPGEHAKILRPWG